VAYAQRSLAKEQSRKNRNTDAMWLNNSLLYISAMPAGILSSIVAVVAFDLSVPFVLQRQPGRMSNIPDADNAV